MPHIDQSSLKLEDFVYDLPPELIAQSPVLCRDQSRLLHYCRMDKTLLHYRFSEISTILQPGDVLVLNNTRVVPAKLLGKTAGGSAIELLLIRADPSAPQLWQAMAIPAKKLRIGDTIFVEGAQSSYSIYIENIFDLPDGRKRLLLRLPSEEKTNTFTILRDAGLAPLPPYIVKQRKFNSIDVNVEEQRQLDLERYQTVFAKHPGAIAAPTAGLHFTELLLSTLLAKGIVMCEITLHVGPGTFKPITTDIDSHIVEMEQFAISESTAQMINMAKKKGQRIIAVGTTTCRALESAYIDGQIRPQENAQTSLFIKPGYEFKIIDGLITNFHLSKSSLLLLVAALIGRNELMRAYQIAIKNKYRFYSYGDAMIIL